MTSEQSIRCTKVSDEVVETQIGKGIAKANKNLAQKLATKELKEKPVGTVVEIVIVTTYADKTEDRL